MKNTSSVKTADKHYLLRKIMLLFACVFLLGGAAWAQQSTLTIHAQNQPLKEVLREIERQSNYSFIYSSSTINVNQKVNLECKDENLDKVLEKLAAIANVSYSVSNRQIMLAPQGTVSQTTPSGNNPEKQFTENRVIKGNVKDENGENIIGASIFFKGTTTGIATDPDGNFTLKTTAPNQILVASFIGYTNEERKIAPNQDTYNFVLKPESKMIEEVIVTGYQTISKERATGSFAILSQKDMADKLQTNVLDRMEGMVAGLNQIPGKDPQIRGISTLEGKKTPLYVVDGIPFEGSGAKNENPLDAINPADIVNITVLKDATAASIYGARSANGVIVITTRNGSTGPTKVSYSGSIKFTPLPDRDYLNLTSSAELVDLQKELFGHYHNAYDPNDRRSMNEVYKLLYEHEAGNLTADELETQLNVYRNQDRYSQVKKEFLRNTEITHQHNLSFYGGSEIYKYSLSVNYQGDHPYEKEQKTQRIGYNLKNQFDFFKWLRVNVGVLGSNVTKDYDNGINGYNFLNGGGPSYRMLRNEDGSATQWYKNKSQLEIDRLNSLGLQDETYRPLEEMGNGHLNYKSNYLNLNLGVNIKIIEGLDLDLRYQTENTNIFQKQYYSKDAIDVKSQINDATVIKDGKVTNYIPLGGQITENKNENNSYTLRAQLNFNREFAEKHDVQVLVGAERRKVVNKGNYMKKFGYDDFSLSYKNINELDLSNQIKGTESIFSSYSYSDSNKPFTEVENRYVSFYGNASYTFNRRLTATGSIRIDQSNLFGTDPKYQYKPLWSVGAHYVLPTEPIHWMDRLVLRATYGINGNVAKDSGPYMIAVNSTRPNTYTNEAYSYISTPPNPALRWEKTKVINIGLDFNTLGNRLNGSIEFYNKNTSDLLGNQASDPTLGWTSLLVNYGKMYNRGVEISLQSENISTGGFQWNSNFVFSYNKNKLTKIENDGTSASTYYSKIQNREGHAMNSLYSIRYAGLDKNGYPTAYDKDGKIITSVNDLTKDDLVYSGTTTPPYSASLTNTLSYKGFDLSFMFVFYGGHVLRDVASSYVFNMYPVLNYASNIDKDRLKFWRNPGDENNPDMAPRFLYGDRLSSSVSPLWTAADKHIQKGNYIKLRDLTLGYSLPKNMLQRCLIQNMRISLQVQNLWYWAANDRKLDPEVWSGLSSGSTSRGTHIPATFTIGLSANF